MKPMYKGIPFSPRATLTQEINGSATVIPVSDVNAFPEAPNLATIGTDDAAETILYSAKTENALSGCTRGVEGSAKAWSAGSIIARNFTAAEYGYIIDNIQQLFNEQEFTADINESGHLIITLGTGREVDCGNAKGDKGDKGNKGDKGDPGEPGAKGDIGPRGPAGAAATINGVTALTIQSGTTVSVNMSGGVATFEFNGDASDVPFTPGSTGMTATDVQAALSELNTDKQSESQVNSLISEALAGFSGGAQVEAGSYVGTGTYGASHKTSYTFQSLPKIVFVFGHSEENGAFGWIIPSLSTGFSNFFEYSGYKPLTTSVSGNTVSWYSTSTNPGTQFNYKGVKYSIVGIG